MSVSGYARTKVPKVKAVENNKPIKATKEVISKAMTHEELEEEWLMLVGDLREKNVDVDNGVYNIPDEEFRNAQLRQINILTDKYKHDLKVRKDAYTTKELKIKALPIKSRAYAQANFSMHKIELNTKWYNNIKEYMESQKIGEDINWHYKVPDDKLAVYSITHEYGHIVENVYMKNVNRLMSKKDLDKDLCDTLMTNAMRKLDKKMTKTEFKKTYWTKYAMSKRNYEWFAETFAKYVLSDEQDIWTETFGEWLEDYFNG